MRPSDADAPGVDAACSDGQEARALVECLTFLKGAAELVSLASQARAPLAIEHSRALGDVHLALHGLMSKLLSDSRREPAEY